MIVNCQHHLHRKRDPRAVTRRWFLEQCPIGLGAVALGALLRPGRALATATDPLAPKAPHFAAKAKNVIFLFMAGGPSHLEMFDYKPQLQKFDGTLPPPELLDGYRAAFINPNSQLLGPEVQLRALRGQRSRALRAPAPHHRDRRRHRDRQVDDHRRLQPRTSSAADEHRLTAVRSAELRCLDHLRAGSESSDLPAFVVFSTGGKGPSGGPSNWGAGFLPTVHQGVQLRTSGDPVLYLSNPRWGGSYQLQRESPSTPFNELNRYATSTGTVGDPGDPAHASTRSRWRIRMQMQCSGCSWT